MMKMRSRSSVSPNACSVAVGHSSPSVTSTAICCESKSLRSFSFSSSLSMFPFTPSLRTSTTTRRFDDEIVRDRIRGIPLRRRGALIFHHQLLARSKDHVGVDVLVAIDVKRGHQRVESRCGYYEVYVRGTERMPSERVQHHAHRTVARDPVTRGLYRHEVELSRGVGVKTRAQIHLGALEIVELQIVQPARGRLPDVDLRIAHRFPVG